MRISHINPNCRDSRFCLPHGEEGPVSYNMERLFKYLNNLEAEVLEAYTERLMEASE